jgi:hypothetical protein
MKQRVDKIDGRDPWEIEIDFQVELRLASPEDARVRTIGRWMHWGDLRPLRTALARASLVNDKMAALDTYILQCLIELIDQGRLVVKPAARSGPGRRQSPDKLARDLLGALLYKQNYEQQGAGKSDNAFQDVADALGMTKDSLRKAVSNWRPRSKTGGKAKTRQRKASEK